MLDRILETKRRQVQGMKSVEIGDLSVSWRSFRAALAEPGLSVIAEVKRRSPSAGQFASTVDPADRARAYQRGGARAISVLTDATFFGGSYDDLRAVGQAVDLPVLCKDFIIAPVQIRHARRFGADACLLIVAALDDAELTDLLREIRRWEMDAMVEVHDGAELGRALRAGACVIGINNRNLHTMEVDRRTVQRLARDIDDGPIVVAESGYACVEDLRALPDRVNAVLIGSALMREGDPARTLTSWLSNVNRTVPGGSDR